MTHEGELAVRNEPGTEETKTILKFHRGSSIHGEKPTSWQVLTFINSGQTFPLSLSSGKGRLHFQFVIELRRGIFIHTHQHLYCNPVPVMATPECFIMSSLHPNK